MRSTLVWDFTRRKFDSHLPTFRDNPSPTSLSKIPTERRPEIEELNFPFCAPKQGRHIGVRRTGLLKVIVWVLTTCHTQHTIDSSM
jgi:hypothetical protein